MGPQFNPCGRLMVTLEPVFDYFSFNGAAV